MGRETGHGYTRACPGESQKEERERERVVLRDYIYKEVIQEEDVNKYSIRKEIHTRKFPSSCIVHFCRLILLTFGHLRCLLIGLS